MYCGGGCCCCGRSGVSTCCFGRGLERLRWITSLFVFYFSSKCRIFFRQNIETLSLAEDGPHPCRPSFPTFSFLVFVTADKRVRAGRDNPRRQSNPPGSGQQEPYTLHYVDTGAKNATSVGPRVLATRIAELCNTAD